MAHLILPNISWFVSKHEGKYVKNTYSGSMGTSPESGCFRTRTFNYRVFVDTGAGQENEFSLTVETYIIQPRQRGSGKTDEVRETFECSDDGVHRAEEWLWDMATKYGF